MPAGKPAGQRCVQLDPLERCLIFGQPERPRVCSGLRPSQDMCGSNREQAMHWLSTLEQLTSNTTLQA